MALLKNRQERLRYLKSNRYRALSFGSLALGIAWWFTRWHGLLLLYLALVVSVIAIAPVYPSFSELRDTRIDPTKKSDRFLVWFVLFLLVGILIIAILLIVHARRSP